MAKSGVRWTRGNPSTMQLDLKRKLEGLRAEAVEALDQSVLEGGTYLQDNLEAAVTKTGLARAERGGFPGRHDTGNMVASVGSEVRNARGKRVIGVFGWWGANFEQYFRDQDLNAPSPARALYPAYIKARENFRRRMKQIVKG
jgi:hypothetical protein